jgi:hypothetical protein
MLQRLTQRYPTLTASGLYAAVVAIVFAPFWRGQFLINDWSDMRNGYAFREFAANYFHRFGGIPEWNPYIFGGMPFLANPANGDTFYPTFLLRLVLPVDVGITLGFLFHITLAGVFTFLFLRALKLDWGAAFVGGAGYMFTGQVVSMVSPGHDGKLFVSALFPLALLFLDQAVTRNEWRRYLAFGVVIGLSLLSPQQQMTYYVLMACGFFWVYLVFLHQPRESTAPWWRSGLLFVAALVVAFAIDAVQLLPFLEYIPFSPRGAPGRPSTGWEYATLFSMPPEELLNVIWPKFSGAIETYWGRNSIKLHSEYLGVATLILATFGLRLEGRRRLGWFFVFLAIYGALFALGGHTPFYRIPYYLLPGIKMTRASGMIFFLTSFSVAVLAGFGAQALMAGQGGKKTPLIAWSITLGAGALIAVAGGWEPMMRALADPQKAGFIAANYPAFSLDTIRALVVGLVTAALCVQLMRGRLRAQQWAPLIALLVLLDLWSVERHFIRFRPPAKQSFAADDIVRALHADSSHYRLVPLADLTDNYWMVHRIRSTNGYHGVELHHYDELLGGKNEWRNLLNPSVWRMLAVKYVTTPQPVNVPVLTLVGTGPMRDYRGQQVYLYRFQAAQPFAYLVAEAVKLPDEQTLPTISDPRFDARRVLLVPPDAPAGATQLAALPDSIGTPVRTTEIRPGAFQFEVTTPLTRPAFLFVAENWYLAWRARVDGRDAPVLRAQYSLIGIPLPAGARSVELTFYSRTYRHGLLITLLTLGLVLALSGYGWWQGRRSRPSDAGGSGGAGGGGG